MSAGSVRLEMLVSELLRFMARIWWQHGLTLSCTGPSNKYLKRPAEVKGELQNSNHRALVPTLQNPCGENVTRLTPVLL